ncbi:uncharacterized protein BT62DRAFT_383413 [Guyanagaster necrorhizus]|uniref:Uncharacterized protein n=1 Tax=Guyanagaster necrorhizus TaxID=856835 RepID=A0A9P7VKW5_9AGAR|nr:uncharacterized protein BT62DRAFT_383413 [Guyanagaster necrorhizus MCA 3950]KAG7442448.1 hypothetical protein BT62DRAFT_383413 [Guyanagaster necrorhizus MCA 3950]
MVDIAYLCPVPLRSTRGQCSQVPGVRESEAKGPVGSRPFSVPNIGVPSVVVRMLAVCGCFGGRLGARCVFTTMETFRVLIAAITKDFVITYEPSNILHWSDQLSFKLQESLPAFTHANLKSTTSSNHRIMPQWFCFRAPRSPC